VACVFFAQLYGRSPVDDPYLVGSIAAMRV
jgi:hypothetical protein